MRDEERLMSQALKFVTILLTIVVVAISSILFLAATQRDEARDEARRLRVQINHLWQANEMAEKAFRERDEAHKLAEKAIDDLAWFNETSAKLLGNKLEQLKEAAK